MDTETKDNFNKLSADIILMIQGQQKLEATLSTKIDLVLERLTATDQKVDELSRAYESLKLEVNFLQQEKLNNSFIITGLP